MSCPKMFLSTAVCVLLYGRLASCFSVYQTRLPNVGLVSSRIPVPINQGINLAGIEVTETGRFCQSVGHVGSCDGPPSGGGNPFGQAFHAPNLGGTFSVAVCRMDSDGDTYTNGDELGDPDCMFEATGIANRTTCLSHPGFPCSTPCDPFCVGMTTNAECPGCAPTTFPPPPPITTTPPFDTTTPPATTAPPPPPITTPPPPINITGAPTGSPPPPPITTPPPFMDLTNTPTPPPPATTPPPVVTFPRPVFPLEQTCPEAIQSNEIASYATCIERLNGQTRLLYEEFVASCAARPTCMLQ